MDDKEAKEIWLKTLSAIKEELGMQGYERWFGPIKLISATAEQFTLGAPNEFFRDWLTEHYLDLIVKNAERVSGKKFQVKLIVGPGLQEPVKPKIPLFGRKPKTVEGPSLSPKFTFDAFVVGPSNRFAHAASLAVADSPAKAYNPLFIYGGVGLGKTHLLHAIGQRIIEKKSRLKVVYISSEQFTNQLINSIQTRTTPKFQERYRGSDVLLIDDIQFIAGKEATQEAFFHTFNALYDAHKQIIISSDRPPKEIPTLEERLVSRFEWGLVTDVQMPDLETRIAILRKKAEREDVVIPNEVSFFIAEKIKSNIRQLEGALIRVVAYSRLMNKVVTIELAEEVLRGIIVAEEKRVTIDLIQKKVAEYFDIRISDMKVKKRTRAIAYPRQIAMYLARDLTNYSLPEIGEQFGGRDHTTILHACDKIQSEVQRNQKTKELLNKLMFDIKN